MERDILTWVARADLVACRVLSVLPWIVAVIVAGKVVSARAKRHV